MSSISAPDPSEVAGAELAILRLSKRVSSGNPRLREAQIKARRIHEEAVLPVFAAETRDQYWALRDAMILRGRYWRDLIDDFSMSVSRVPRNLRDSLRLPTDPLSPAKRVATRALSSTTKNNLERGFDLLARDEELELPAPEKLGISGQLELTAEVEHHVAQYVLCGLWATALRSGQKPADRLVAESISKNFVQVAAASLAMKQELIERRSSKDANVSGP